MKRKVVEAFKLKRFKHPVFGNCYEYIFQKRDWVKDEIALQYSLIEIKRWAEEEIEKLEDILDFPNNT